MSGRWYEIQLGLDFYSAFILTNIMEYNNTIEHNLLASIRRFGVV